MKTNYLIMVAACAGLLSSCATAPPRELLDARAAYKRASQGPASRVAPAELHTAKVALDEAEQAFDEEPESYLTKDLAYVAHRKTQKAEATASIKLQQNKQGRAQDEYQDTQDEIVENSRAKLKASEQKNALTASQLSSEQDARMAAEKRAADAHAALAKLAEVKEEPRGTVITLSGSVLFASNQATLLPAARSRLDQVVAVLLSSRERNIVVEGHTDSQGSENHNRELSQRRANAVRDYIVQHEYEADLIKAKGMGEGHPIARNTSVEGRANNRRVEIIIEPETHSNR